MECMMATSLTIMHSFCVTLSLKPQLMISLAHKVLGWCNHFGGLVETGRRRLRCLNVDVSCCVRRFICSNVPIWNVVMLFGNNYLC